MMLRDEILEESGVDSVEELMFNARMDFKFFCEKILKLNNDNKPIIIKKFHEEWVDAFLRNKRSLIAACRGSGKTSILSIYFPLWRMLYHKQEKFLVVSNNLDNSKYLLGQVRNYIEDNEILNVLKPLSKNLSWTKTLLNTSTGCSVRCKPFSDSIRTLHVNWLILDEVSLYRDVEIYNSAVSPTIKRLGGHLMAIGTPRTLIDLMQKFKENKKFEFTEYPATKDGVLLFPEGLPQDVLDDAREEMGALDYNREYLLNITSGKDAPIPLGKIIKCFDGKSRFINSIENDNQERKIFIGADFALSATGDWSVFTVVEKIGDNYVVLKMERMRGVHWREQICRFEKLNNDFKPIRILADASNFGRTFVSEMRARGLPVMGFDFAAKNKKELYVNLVNVFGGSEVTIPRDQNDSTTMSITDQLVEELTHIIVDRESSYKLYKSVAKHDDCVDSLALALEAGRRFSSGVRYMATHKRRSASENRKTSNKNPLNVAF